MKFLTRKGYLIEEQGMTYLADTDPHLALGAAASGGLHGRGQLLRRRVAASIARALIMAAREDARRRLRITLTLGDGTETTGQAVARAD